MWFKNLQIYRVPAPWNITKEFLAASLRTQGFMPTGTLIKQSMGWVPPVEHGDLVHAVNGQFLMKLCIEKKLLPAAVIAEVVKLRVAEVEEQQGFAPGRKQTRELKESITDELMPRAFSVKSYTSVWVDPINGWLGIDSASDARADDVMKLLLKSIQTCPVTSVRTIESPSYAMTNWLDLDNAPAGFTVDQDTELSSGDASVRYKNNTPENDVLRRQIASGKKCTKLALTWGDQVSFILTDSFTIKRITPHNIIQDYSVAMENEHDAFDADFILMAGCFNGLIEEIIEALGGEDQQTDIVQQAATITNGQIHAAVSNIEKLLLEDGATALMTSGGRKPLAHFGDGPDPLYDQAVAVVKSNKRASISLVQRHLRIGYNRAARLMDTMESAKVVGAMQTNGIREVLHVGQ